MTFSVPRGRRMSATTIDSSLSSRTTSIAIILTRRTDTGNDATQVA
ncbi:hypothetical protein J2X36_003761 [Methylobacterium sp. BE186]|nr:hypothetical protein [Methylobacterium sp. BE186]